jgi:hypothetical protein
LLDGSGRLGPDSHDDVGLQADQLLRERSCPIGVITQPSKVHPHVAAIEPTQVCKRLPKRGEETLPRRIVLVARGEHADAPYALRRLRPRHNGPEALTSAVRRKKSPTTGRQNGGDGVERLSIEHAGGAAVIEQNDRERAPPGRPVQQSVENQVSVLERHRLGSRGGRALAAGHD